MIFSDKTQKLLLLSSLLIVFITMPLRAEVTLPNVFTSNMVLQRDIPIKAWGKADPREKISIWFHGDSVLLKADKKGDWQAQLPAYPAGGPFELVIKGENEIVLSNILLGDVWVCSGQSNMEWPLQAVNNAEEEIKNAAYPRIRLFTIEKKTSTVPLDDCRSDGWMVCSSETAAAFSAVGYFFGRKLNDELDVPIGLINTSWGGTNAETWTSVPSIEQLPGFEGTGAELASFNEEAMIAAQRAKVESITGPLPDTDLGIEGEKALWASPDVDFMSWKSMELPQLWESTGLDGLDGVVWFEREFVLDQVDLSEDLEVSLGPIDDSDITWLNGVEIGRTTQKHNEARKYSVKSEGLKVGRNVLVVRAEDTGGGGGIYGDADELYVKAGSKKVNLAGSWSYRVGRGDFTLTTGPNSMPSLLYNGMIHPIIKLGIKGAIWYQGESNAGRAYQYRALFPAMITDWRKQWNIGDFPFFFVQLANFMQPKPHPGESEWAELREAQTMTLSLPNTGMATIIDIGEANDIHPRNKQDVGKRLAFSALKVAYNKDVVPSGPMYKEMQIDGKTAIISFDHLGSGFYLKDKYGYVHGFAIAGSDKVFHWAKAKISGDKIIVWSDAVVTAVAVRYGWADNPDDLNLYNMEGLPAVPFRTDDWPGVTVDKKYK